MPQSGRLADLSSTLRGTYLLPHDDYERDRLDIMHAMFKLVREDEKRLINCPPDHLMARPSKWEDYSPRVLDLGCGTGIWMLDMAKRFRNVQFVGVDFHRMGPPKLEPNVIYTAPWDYEGEWTFAKKSWDMIHLQMGLGSVADWQDLYRKILLHLVPGTGYFELVELDYEPRSANGLLPAGILKDWWHRYISPCYTAHGRRLDYDPATPEILASLGFKDVTHQQYMIPLTEWHDERLMQRAGMWWQVAMGAGRDGKDGHGLEALSLSPLCRYNTWSTADALRLCDDAFKQASDPNLRAYNVLHIITGRAPGTDER